MTLKEGREDCNGENLERVWNVIESVLRWHKATDRTEDKGTEYRLVGGPATVPPLPVLPAGEGCCFAWFGSNVHLLIIRSCYKEFQGATNSSL